MSEDDFERVRARGGSPWARDILLSTLYVDEKLGERGDPKQELKRSDEARLEPGASAAATAPAGNDRPVRDPAPLPRSAYQFAEGFCPRWMHHFPGETCIVCGEMG